MIDPVRILETRDPFNVGLNGPFVAAVSQKLQVTGAVPTTNGTQTPVPSGATGVLLNVTVVGPTARGNLSVRPGDASGVPSTSSLNFTASATVPNSVQVGLPTAGTNAGQIDITYSAGGVVGATTEVLIDVVGYTVAGGTGTGTTGPSNAFVSHISGGQDQPSALSTVTSVSVPAGSYVVSAKLYGIADSTTGNHGLLCNLMSGADQLDFTNSNGEPNSYNNLSLAGSITLASPGMLLLTCQSSTGGAAAAAPYRLYGISLTAISVGTLS